MATSTAAPNPTQQESPWKKHFPAFWARHGRRPFSPVFNGLLEAAAKDPTLTAIDLRFLLGQARWCYGNLSDSPVDGLPPVAPGDRIPNNLTQAEQARLLGMSEGAFSIAKTRAIERGYGSTAPGEWLILNDEPIPPLFRPDVNPLKSVDDSEVSSYSVNPTIDSTFAFRLPKKDYLQQAYLPTHPAALSEWREHSQALAEIAAQMEALKREAAPHRRALHRLELSGMSHQRDAERRFNRENKVAAGSGAKKQASGECKPQPPAPRSEESEENVSDVRKDASPPTGDARSDSQPETPVFSGLPGGGLTPKVNPNKEREEEGVTTTTLQPEQEASSSSSSAASPGSEHEPFARQLAKTFVDAGKPVPFPAQSKAAYWLLPAGRHPDFLRWLPASSEFRRMQHPGGLPTLIEMFLATHAAVAEPSPPLDDPEQQAQWEAEQRRREERDRIVDERIRSIPLGDYEVMVQTRATAIRKQRLVTQEVARSEAELQIRIQVEKEVDRESST